MRFKLLTICLSKMLFFVILSVSPFLQAFAYDEECLQRASLRYGVPEIVIRAIIDMESGGKRLAMNIEGKPYFPESDLEAQKILEQNKGRSTDVGLMQINSFWFKKLNVPQTYGFRECFNINFGTWILAYEIENHGLNLKAIGKYHSPDNAKGRSYSSRVLDIMIKILKNG
ncbi:lytic transglycosylase domain-containing protein [Seleniivibrio woodruffii]|uniref:Transglycosylase-like protein with SLT domain n=2 Tax=Seleniivibrio woodruffii TaxID=1078050 RepID=A0A4R1KCR1_9BACT|nr:transglycosylase-like protein with SLT domain [Seleniivibrio woodruffii]TVZ34548.1 transglycosylase-like protein with SLT domain [Seleniivibrio woodruffii]